ncbi:hypothetical protein ACSBR2_012705 [Camellia fascicularis]
MNRSMQTSVGILSLIRFLTIAAIDFSFCNGNHDVVVMCREGEKQTLLQFKKDLEDPTNGLSSWEVEDDCCKWEGVLCDNFTGHVLELNLRNSYTDGIVDGVSQWYDKFRLNGKINPCLQKLKHLKYLDLSENDFTNIPFPPVIASMTQLQYINLSNAEFVGTIPHQLGNLSSLRSLSLQSIMNVENLQWLSGQIPQGSWNLTSLETLDVSYNQNLNSSLLNSLFSTTNCLVYLSLTNCGFQGPFPTIVPNMTNLSYLDLSYNSLNSTIPSWLYSFSRLEVLNLGSNSLDLSYNGLEGRLPNSIGNLASLEILQLSYNGLEESLPRSLGNLCNLRHIGLSHNKFSGELFISSSKCIAIHALEDMLLDGNKLSGHIPDQIGQFQNLTYILLSGNLLSGPIPETLGRLTSLRTLSLEDNQLNGTLPQSLRHLSKLLELHVSNNLLEGPVSEVHFTNLPNLRQFHASGNRLTVKVSPDWIPLFQLLEIELRSWHLGPEFPIWLQSQKQLDIIDLSCTGISDGMIPLELCRISSLQILDLANNNLSGAIPWCINNITSMAMKRNSGVDLTYRVTCSSKRLGCWSSAYLDNANLVTKGSNYQYDKILALVTIIDVSNNNLYGSIPEELTGLLGLLSLNLSRNHLIGVIPKKMGDMVSLESLDLSKNQIRGEIPPSMSGLTFLSYLNLSYNNLSGKIPLSTQLQSFNASSFLGNKLCGLPLTKNCSVDGEKPNVGNEGSEVDWFYLSMAFGFVVGFWGVSIPILFIKSWRYVYFRFLDNVWTRLYVYIQVNMIRF